MRYLSHITPPLKRKKNLRRFPQIPGNRSQNEYQSNFSGQCQKPYNKNQKQQAPKTKVKFNMVGPLRFNNYKVNVLHQDVQNFQGGSLRYFSKNWYKYTNDTYILDIVTNGLKLELNELPFQCSRSTYPLSGK